MIEGALLWLLWRRHRPEPAVEDLEKSARPHGGWLPGFIDETN
ncbi:hypothetical protein ACFYY8_31710 [Streptosporangium sp. NPDC001559]